MKKIILLIAAALFALPSFAQDYSPNRHVSLKDCGYDTLQYIKLNFWEHRDRYIGLPMDSLFNDIELEIKDFGWIMNEHRKTKGIIFSYLHPLEQTQFNRLHKAFYILRFYFRAPYTVSIESYPKGGVYWTEKYRDFFKDFIIDRVLLVKMQNNEEIESLYSEDK